MLKRGRIKEYFSYLVGLEGGYFKDFRVFILILEWVWENLDKLFFSKKKKEKKEGIFLV